MYRTSTVLCLTTIQFYCHMEVAGLRFVMYMIQFTYCHECYRAIHVLVRQSSVQSNTYPVHHNTAKFDKIGNVLHTT